MLKVFVNQEQIQAALGDLPEDVLLKLTPKIHALTIKLEAKVKKKLSGIVLNVRTGRLRRSIFHDFPDVTNAITGRVYQAGDIKYGKIHEYGGQTSPHEIVARRKEALRFVVGGKTIFRRRVSHPGSRIPARPYMRPSLVEIRPEFDRTVEEAVDSALRE